MPPKKRAAAGDSSSATTSPSNTTGVGGLNQVWDMSDPISAASGIIDKKARNLEKRKNKLTTLKLNADTGHQLDKDQREAVKRLDEVNTQIDLIKDLQKQFTSFAVDYQKVRKRQQKLERQQQKDAEKDHQRKLLSYSLSVMDLLNAIDEDAKEAFAAGSNGAIQLSESELSQLDSLYRLLAPSRVGNPSYRSDLMLAGDHLMLLHDQSSKEAIGSTYKELADLLQRVDGCGYFDKPHNEEEEEEEEEEDEEEEEVEEVESHDAHVTVVPPVEPPVVTSDLHEAGYENGYQEQMQDKGMEQADYIPQSSLPATLEPLAPPPPVNTQPIMDYMPPSVPSPTFPGLEVGQQSAQDGGFSFMHDSEVARPPPSTQAPPPSHAPQYTNYPAVPQVEDIKVPMISDKSSTDVATGQSSPSPFQTKPPSPFQTKPPVVMASGLAEQQVPQEFAPSAVAGEVGVGGEQPLSQQPARDDGFQQQRNYGNRGGNMRGGGRGGGGGGWGGDRRERSDKGDWSQQRGRGGGGGGQRYSRGGGNGRSYGNQQGGGGGGYGQSSRGYNSGGGRGGDGGGRGGDGGGRGGRPNYKVSSGPRK